MVIALKSQRREMQHYSAQAAAPSSLSSSWPGRYSQKYTTFSWNIRILMNRVMARNLKNILLQIEKHISMTIFSI